MALIRQRRCLLLGLISLIGSLILIFLLGPLNGDLRPPKAGYYKDGQENLKLLQEGGSSSEDQSSLDEAQVQYDYYADKSNKNHLLDNRSSTGSHKNSLLTDKASQHSSYFEKSCEAFQDFTFTCVRRSNSLSPGAINDNHQTISSSLFVPISLLFKYFEVQVRPDNQGNGPIEIFYSNGRIFDPPLSGYDYKGQYLWFSVYNVQVRDRVKYLSGQWNVPISSQWDPKGHYYPIQISQFGLSHFSKSLIANESSKSPSDSSKNPLDLLVPDTVRKGYSSKKLPWQFRKMSDSIVKIKRFHNQETILIDGLVDGLVDYPHSIPQPILTADILPESNFSITCVVKTPSDEQYTLIYVVSQKVGMRADIRHKTITFGIGSDKMGFTSIIRDLVVDVTKGLYRKGKNKKMDQDSTSTESKIKSVRVVRLTIRGRAVIKHIRIQESADVEYYQAASRWLLRHQENGESTRTNSIIGSNPAQSGGGWPIQVSRKLGNSGLVLRPPWYSAMGQGQGMSLLTRMYHITKNLTYLEAALRASYPFDIDASLGGVRTHFMDRWVWFEEYPTLPTSTFVLNGFIYSLIGLYDTMMTCADAKEDILHSNETLLLVYEHQCTRVRSLYEEGIQSLRAMLMLYDTGSGTLYDLRHVPLGLAPNLARWDYHTTHINQLLYLSTFADDNHLLFHKTAQRWIDYMKRGLRAPHN